MAPTKPLVAQQIDACHQTCGIPGRDAAELTGNVPKAQRSRAVGICFQIQNMAVDIDRHRIVGRETRILHDASDPVQ